MSQYHARTTASKKTILLSTLVLALMFVLLLGSMPTQAAGGSVSPTDERSDQTAAVFSADPSAGVAQPAGPVATLNVDGSCIDSDSNGLCDDNVTYKTIQAAIAASASNDTISVAAGTYTEVGQIVIAKNLTITGADRATTIIKPAADTGGTGDARGWFLVNSGITFDLSHVTLDGQGRFVHSAIRTHGNGTLNDIAFQNIVFTPGSYDGRGVSAVGDVVQNITISNSTFNNIGRIGALVFGTTTAVISGNTYTGKGTGDWLDYAFEAGGGGNATITGNTITGCTGVAYDGSTSAGILATTYFDAGTSATITHNFITGNTGAVAVGYNATDTSVVVIHDNDLSGNVPYAVGSTTPVVDASGNWWGSADPAAVKLAADTGDVEDYTPWLASGTDTDLVTAGFQGDFSNLWVDDDSSQTGTVGRIQEGINLVSGSTVNVAAGSYVEDPVIDKAVTLLGPNAGINPNTGSRVAEAVILPAISAPDPATCEVMVLINVSDVVIKGFTFDGDNPALTSGVMIDGADVDACEILAGYEGMGNIVVENNILKHSTYSGIDFYNYTNTAATAGNYIRYNRFEDIGETTYNWGIGVLIYNNFYADITDNVMTGVRTGVQTGNYYNANPGTTGSISNNQIGVWRLGIFHNLAYSNASPFTISGNTITAETYPGATKWNGLLLSSIQNTVNATISNNDIVIPGTVSFAPPGYTAGYNVWNVTTTAPIAISGGTVTGGDYGVFVNNYEGYSSNANNTAVKIDGVTVLGSAIAGVYVKDSPSNTNGATVYANIQNCALDTDATGILVEGADATAKANSNNLAGNPTFGVTNTSTALMDAENNWWGTACEPSAKVSGPVDYTPWWGDSVGSFTLTATATAINPGDSATKQMAVINCAAPGTTVAYPTGTYPGGIIVTANGVTINLNGNTVGAGSPAFTIVGDDVVLQGPGTLDGNGDASPAVLVKAGADNFTLKDVEVREWLDGVEIEGSVASLKIVNNWIHDNTDAGLQVDSGATIGGVVTINGNLFKVNTGPGVRHDGAGTLNAEHNSWGDIGGPAAGVGDGVAGSVDSEPWTFAEIFTDMAPDTLATVRNAVENDTFDVAVKVDAAGLFAAQYKLTYDPTLLTLTGTADGAFVGSGVCSTDTAAAGVVTVYCTRYEPNLDVNNTSGETITTLTFKADLDASHDGEDGPWTTHLDLSVLPADLTAGARGGVKVFVNNGGFGADSGKPGHIITDAQDGQVNITGLAQYTGYIDLQGQTDDSGAVLAVYNQAAVAGSVKLASATSAKGGKYTTAFESGKQMVVGTTYYFQVDRVLYLPTTRVFAPAAVSWADFKALSDRPEMLLGMVVLLGGDATNDNIVELDDATCIGGDYGGAPDVCGTGGTSDVNGDGRIDILDLTLMGGNYMKTSSDWTP